MNGPAALEGFAAAVPRLRRARAGSVVHLAPDETTLRLASGWAGIQRRFADGRRKLLDLVLPGDLVGVHQFGRLESLEVVALTAASFEPTPAEGPCLVDQLAQFQARILRQVLRLGGMSASERLADFLLELSDRQSRADPGASSSTIDQLLRQERLADLLGMSPVHLNRCLKMLRTQGLIRMRSKALVLDLPGLRAQLPA